MKNDYISHLENWENNHRTELKKRMIKERKMNVNEMQMQNDQDFEDFKVGKGIWSDHPFVLGGVNRKMSKNDFLTGLNNSKYIKELKFTSAIRSVISNSFEGKFSNKKASIPLKTQKVAEENLQIAKEIIGEIETFKKDVDEIEKKIRYILDVDGYKNYKIKQEEMDDVSRDNDLGIAIIIDFDQSFDEDYEYSFERQIDQLHRHYGYTFSTVEHENSKTIEVYVQTEFTGFIPYPYTDK